MIQEIARITVKPGEEAAFEAAIGTARAIFARAPGCLTLALHRSVEQPSVYMLLISWKTLADHMEGFRNSALFGEWRALASPFFAAPPSIEHSVAVALD